MSRLSRAMKREQKRAAAAGVSEAAPIDVRVPAGGAGHASIGGVPVTVGPGEEVHHAVLTHLQRIAVAGGRPVLALVHDERIGYVVPLRVEQDGSSSYTAEPVRTAPAPPPTTGPAGPAGPTRPAGPVGLAEPTGPTGPAGPVGLAEPARPAQGSADHAPAPRPASPAAAGTAPPAPPSAAPGGTVWPSAAESARPSSGPGEPVWPSAPSTASTASGEAGESQEPGDAVWPAAGPGASEERADAGPEPYRDAVTQVLRPLPRGGAGQDAGDALDGPPTFRLRPIPTGGGPARVPGTVAPPLGVFGPPPSMGGAAGALPADRPASPGPDSEPDPPRGFDAVAEAVLGDPPEGAVPGTSPFAGPLERIHEAVRAGRTEEAAPLVRQTVAQASAVLGPEHPEVLRMRELAAYIAYLGGEPERAFALCLAAAWAYHRAADAEAAYSGLHGAATAWRAVRNPAQGLDLGRELLALWDELVAGGGPAARDPEELESARARMDRLTARAAATDAPPAGTTG
ncbi:hypothetical protein [Streptomyces zinciresistens]|nr:hypothetical protein [Streptomyces zinciresistens]